MAVKQFLDKIKRGEMVSFADTIATIADNYNYQQTEFINGIDDEKVINPAGKNEGSCKIFAFAKLHQLNEQETLSLFGDYYRIDVLEHPENTDHANIRQFMKHGWAGITFQGEALTTNLNN